MATVPYSGVLRPVTETANGPLDPHRPIVVDREAYERDLLRLSSGLWATPGVATAAAPTAGTGPTAAVAAVAAAGSSSAGALAACAASSSARRAPSDAERRQTARLAFQQTLENLQGLYLCHGSAELLRAYVTANDGLLLRLRNPATWYLMVTPSGAVFETRERQDFSRYLCCGQPEPLEMVGVLVIRLGEITYEMSTCAVYLGGYGRVYVYDWDTDGLFHVASSLRHLAGRGLRDCEPVYRHPLTPYLTTQPAELVRALLEAAASGPGAVAAVAAHYWGRNLVLRTPDREPSPLLLHGSARALSGAFPFVTMTAEAYRGFARYVSERLACPWYVLGAVGSYSSDGLFTARVVVILDVAGAVYGVRAADPRGLCRLADDLPMFFKIGLLKEAEVNRYDRNGRGEGRLEKVPRCFHGGEARRRALQERGRRLNQQDLRSALDWFRVDADWCGRGCGCGDDGGGGGWSGTSPPPSIVLEDERAAATGRLAAVPPRQAVIRSTLGTRHWWRDPDRHLPWGPRFNFRCPLYTEEAGEAEGVTAVLEIRGPGGGDGDEAPGEGGGGGGHGPGNDGQPGPGSGPGPGAAEPGGGDGGGPGNGQGNGRGREPGGWPAVARGPVDHEISELEIAQRRIRRALWLYRSNQALFVPEIPAMWVPAPADV
ncbi:T5 [Tupaiid betaherpesvirus 1]|uniref:T5 n=1 Tax=Tupaiid herpesvirus 1 (strain 1) TaxID=10397 RepID=Q91TV8_TUHV1|nr:T5 [Tupaiid betaherpesvirus 1]AAK57029.1 T5 [Tupaiid betaherpesvirus 1]